MKTIEKKITANNLYLAEHRIRPAARHILTIGKGIIKDYYTAVLELVKNAYDADATRVDITFDTLKDRGIDKLRLTIKDNGHGMDNETIVHKWLVPSTDNKVRKPKSHYFKRNVQGKKGIGRYAVSILGDEMTLITTDKEKHEQSIVMIDWNIFKDTTKYLDEIKILVETMQTEDVLSGTTLEIHSEINAWTESELLALVGELRTLIPPKYNAEDEIIADKNKFEVYLHLKNLSSCGATSGLIYYTEEPQKIEPVPIMEYYHYRIHGVVEMEGDKLLAKVEYINNYEGHSLTLPLTLKLPYPEPKNVIYNAVSNQSYVGKIELDIRAFDRDAEGLNNLKDRTKLDVNGTKMKQLLNEFYGIRVYMQDFRVRPYGDKKDDWLDLNAMRVNDPTRRLSTNQVLGIIKVEEFEKSGLDEKATREGFKDNEAFKLLKNCIIHVIRVLEDKRYEFRKATEKGRPKKDTITQSLEKAANFEYLNNALENLIKDLPEDAQMAIKDLIAGKAQEISETFEDIQNTIAIYQQKIMLGKLVTFLLHEGRRPLHLLRGQGKNLPIYAKMLTQEIQKMGISGDLGSILKQSTKMEEGAEVTYQKSKELSELFKVLEPLASEQVSPAETLQVIKTLKEAFLPYNSALAEKGIAYEIVGNETLELKIRKVDIQNTIIGNMIDNSIYWLSASSKDYKKISLIVSKVEQSLVIDFQDNGLGIS